MQQVKHNRIFISLSSNIYKSQKQLVQQISYNHTCKLLESHPQIVFYDVTTIYFEVEQEDELRRSGFSKNSYPLAYNIF